MVATCHSENQKIQLSSELGTRFETDLISVDTQIPF